MPGRRQTSPSCHPHVQASATSVKVAGCLKNMGVVWGGILQGDVVTMQELQANAGGCWATLHAVLALHAGKACCASRWLDTERRRR